MSAENHTINQHYHFGWLSFFTGLVVGGFGVLAMLALICLVQNMKH